MPELWEATANGEITATDENCTERGFVYGKTAQSAPGDTAPANTGYTDSVSESGSFGAGTFSLSLPGLDADATYYVRAYAQNEGGYGYGDEVSFETGTPAEEYSETVTALSVVRLSVTDELAQQFAETVVIRSPVWASVESVASVVSVVSVRAPQGVTQADAAGLVSAVLVQVPVMVDVADVVPTYRIAGTTKDTTGAVLANCDVYLLRYSAGSETLEFSEHTTSNGSGEYEFILLDGTANCVVIARKTGDPNVFDVTDFNLQPEAVT